MYLNNYFNFHVCLSIRSSVRLLVWVFVCLCVRKPAPFPAVILQNVTNKRCLVWVKSENYAFWFTLRLLGSIRCGEIKLHTSWHHNFRWGTAEPHTLVIFLQYLLWSKSYSILQSLITYPGLVQSSCVLRCTRAVVLPSNLIKKRTP